MTRGGKRPGAGRPEKLKKTLILLVMIIFCTMPAYSYTLQGSVEYTVDSARSEAFENIAYTLPREEYSDYLVDGNAIFNTYDLKNGRSHAGVPGIDSRKLVSFYKWNMLVSYGVRYDKIPNKCFHYSIKGKLLKIDIRDFNGSYPYKSISYDAKGNLISINFAISDKKAYMYDNNKKFIGYWLDNQFYEPNGKKGFTRRL